jgi:predicted HTH transcriptional regulator
VIWSPSTEQEIRDAAANGLLIESHYLDFKREVPSGESGTKGLAKDIAAFALDGGTILIGIDEDSSPPALTPVELDGLPERVEQIGAMSVQEGVAVSTVVIETTPGSGRGYLVIRVPASPRAPHMADGKYYGRGDKRNRVLSHAEVLRLHQQQHAQEQDIIQATHQELQKFLALIRGWAGCLIGV